LPKSTSTHFNSFWEHFAPLGSELLID